MIKYWNFFLNFFKSLINSKDPEPDHYSEFMDPDPQYFQRKWTTYSTPPFESLIGEVWS